MDVTDVMRDYAEATYGASAQNFLQALGRIEPVSITRGWSSLIRVEDRQGYPLNLGIEVRDGSLLVNDDDEEGSGRKLSAEEGLRSGWDLIAAADAVRFGWLP